MYKFILQDGMVVCCKIGRLQAVCVVQGGKTFSFTGTKIVFPQEQKKNCCWYYLKK
jgi:hypothetical protein